MLTSGDLWDIAVRVTEEGFWRGSRGGKTFGLRVMTPSGRFHFYTEGPDAEQGDSATIFAALFELNELLSR